MNLGVSLIGAIGVAISGTILYYLNYLRTEKCECALNWRHDFLFAYMIIGILVGSYSVLTGKNMLDVVPLLFPVFFALAIAYYVIGYQYLDDLESKPCPCSVSDIRTFFKYYLYFQIAVTSLSALVAIGGLGYIGYKISRR